MTHIKKENGKTVSRVTTVYEAPDNGKQAVKETVHTEENDLNTALTTTTTYFYSPGNRKMHEQIISRVNPDGSWVRYEYDAEGRRTEEYRPWGDTPFAPYTAGNTYERIQWTLYENDGYVLRLQAEI